MPYLNCSISLYLHILYLCSTNSQRQHNQFFLFLTSLIENHLLVEPTIRTLHDLLLMRSVLTLCSTAVQPTNIAQQLLIDKIYRFNYKTD